jgi:hypothetical protein
MEAYNRKARNMAALAEPVENGTTRIVFQQEEEED